MLILASGSPRRRELLQQIGLSFAVTPPEIDEDQITADEPGALVAALSLAKAKAVAADHPEALVLGSDTVVVLDDEILGKPRDAAEAVAMLTRLQGRRHRVYTGLALVQGDREVAEFEVTEVQMRPLSEAQIKGYVASGEPLDKAGAYGIQGLGAALVEAIEGDYFTVVGLPVARLARLLEGFGLDVFQP